MKGLKEIKQRIQAIKSIENVTSAMKLMSSAKLKIWQNKLNYFNDYTSKIKEIIASIDFSGVSEISEFVESPTHVQKKLYILLTSNKGLCGAFNNQIIKYLVQNIQITDNANVFITAGKKAKQFFQKYYPKKIFKDISSVWEKFDVSKLIPIIDEILTLYRSGEFQEINIAYNNFKNLLVYIPTIERILPLGRLPEITHKKTEDLIYEPSKKDVCIKAIKAYIETVFITIFLRSYVAEHAARMTSLHQAIENAKELKRTLTIEYNKARQAHITKEIIEVVAGAQAIS